MATIDSLVIGERAYAIEGRGPWFIGSGPSDLALDDGAARRVRVSRCGEMLELNDVDGEPLVLREARRPRQLAALGDAVGIGRSQVLVAQLATPRSERALRAGPLTVRWQGMLATARTSLLQLEAIARAAGSRAPVFVAGESGTGKELAARAVHAASVRQDKPFVALNCAALPETLAESELFGVERGAYTGATRTRAGVFAEADGGTLFLDEIGELSPLVQAKLLRALETGEVHPVGGGRSVKVDVRIVAASWRDLEDQAELGRFRHDLLHRLCVLRVELAPLRDRAADIVPLLLDMLRAHHAIELAPDPLLAARLVEATWRGNIRELRNCVDRAVTARDPALLVPRERALRPFIEREPVGRDLVASTLTHYGGNRRRAATALGVSRSTLYRWMRTHDEHGPPASVADAMRAVATSPGTG